MTLDQQVKDQAAEVERLQAVLDTTREHLNQSQRERQQLRERVDLYERIIEKLLDLT